MNDTIEQYQTDVQSGETVLQALMRESDLPDPVIVNAACKGAVWVSLQRGRGKSRPQRLHKLATTVAEGSTVMLNYNPQVLASIALPMKRISDHVNYSIWFKPSGMLCQGSKWSDHTVATQVAAGICHRHCFLVHRLDKAARGLMVIAHTKNSLTKLTAMFEQRQIKKTYQAIVTGKYSHDLPHRIDLPVDDREAHTSVNAVEIDSAGEFSTLTLTIDTGRKHQIRKHLAAQGHPIVGDRMHSPPGTAQRDEIDLQLVACALEFQCPFTKEHISTSINARKALNGDELP